MKTLLSIDFKRHSFYLDHNPDAELFPYVVSFFEKRLRGFETLADALTFLRNKIAAEHNDYVSLLEEKLNVLMYELGLEAKANRTKIQIGELRGIYKKGVYVGHLERTSSKYWNFNHMELDIDGGLIWGTQAQAIEQLEDRYKNY